MAIEIKIKSELAIGTYFVAFLYTFVTFFGYIMSEGFDFYRLGGYYFDEGLGIVLIMVWVFAFATHLWEARRERDDNEEHYEIELNKLKSEVASLKRKKKTKKKTTKKR